MKEAAASTNSLVAPARREYRFNKLAGVTKTAGCLALVAAIMFWSVLSGVGEGENLSDVVRETPAGTALLYAAIALVFLGALLMAVMKPTKSLLVDGNEVVFASGDRQARLAIESIIAVAPFERKGRGIVGRRTPRRSIAILAREGTNLVDVPEGVRWKSINPIETLDDDDSVDIQLEEQDARQQLRVKPAHRVNQLVRNNEALRAMIVPLHGMPSRTEDELRHSLPSWI